MNPAKSDQEQPPDPADVDIKRIIDERIELHKRVLAVALLGRELYQTNFNRMYPKDEWTRTRGGR